MQNKLQKDYSNNKTLEFTTFLWDARRNGIKVEITMGI
jgi:hypothetical protein